MSGAPRCVAVAAPDPPSSTALLHRLDGEWRVHERPDEVVEIECDRDRVVELVGAIRAWLDECGLRAADLDADGRARRIRADGPPFRSSPRSDRRRR